MIEDLRWRRKRWRNCWPRWASSSRIAGLTFPMTIRFLLGQFKTMKYRPEFPDRFDGHEDALGYCRRFFKWYNDEHDHTGIGLLTPRAPTEGWSAALRRRAPGHRSARASLEVGLCQTSRTLCARLPQAPGAADGSLDQPTASQSQRREQKKTSRDALPPEA